VGKFQSHYPNWRYAYDIDALLGEIYHGFEGRL
jgi:hypothetical protein